MSKKTNESKKRANSLILLIAFTAILLVASTYAWFSTQKNVSIKNLKGKVEVAEGLQISLDADNWDQEIDLSNWEAYDKGIGTEVAVDDTNKVSSNNYRPLSEDVTTSLKYTENSIGFMVPASTSGILTSDAYNTIPLISGKYIGNKLKGTEVIDESNDGVYAFDIYLMNTSKVGTETDQLQLNFNSKVKEIIPTGGNDYGLKNSVRVALGLFSKNTSNSEHDGSGTSLTQKEILATTNAYESCINQVAIWEPNYNIHSNYARKQSKVLNKFLTDKEIEYVEGNELTDKVLNTYAVKAMLTTSNVVNDAYTATAGDPCLEEYIVNQTSGTYVTGLGKYISADGSVTKEEKYANETEDATTPATKFKSTVSDTTPILNGESVEANETGVLNIKDVAGGDFKLAGNSISRVRIYIWLEGQDPDCVNWASQSSGIDVTIGLCKGSGVGSTTEDHDA